MAGTMQGLYTREVSLPRELYERLSELPTRVVQRYHDINEKGYSLRDAFSLFRTKRHTNVLTANKVLEERAEEN